MVLFYQKFTSVNPMYPMVGWRMVTEVPTLWSLDTYSLILLNGQTIYSYQNMTIELYIFVLNIQVIFFKNYFNFIFQLRYSVKRSWIQTIFHVFFQIRFSCLLVFYFWLYDSVSFMFFKCLMKLKERNDIILTY